MAPKPKRGVEMTSYIRIRLTEDEKRLFKMASERLDMTISDFVRFWCLPIAEDIYKGAPKEKVLSTFAGTADYFDIRYQASKLKPVPFEKYTFQTLEGEEGNAENES